MPGIIVYVSSTSATEARDNRVTRSLKTRERGFDFNANYQATRIASETLWRACARTHTRSRFIP